VAITIKHSLIVTLLGQVAQSKSKTGYRCFLPDLAGSPAVDFFGSGFHCKNNNAVFYYYRACQP